MIRMKRKTVIYFDMDGVLADFDKSVKEKKHIDELPWLNIPHFFRDLEPIGNPDQTILRLQQLDFEVFILTKVEQRDHLERVFDKMKWVAKHIPSISLDRLICVPIHHDKSSYLKSPIDRSLLLDDYKGNLLLWKKEGGISVKFGNKIKDTRVYHQITNDISKLVGLALEIDEDSI